MTERTLWIFGSSLCLPFNLNESAVAWPNLLANKLNITCKNFSEPGADNFFIYQNYLYHKKHISPYDTLIILWSHYSRKSFVYDQNNPEQLAVYDCSLQYRTGSQTFIRNVNPASSIRGWLSMKPRDTGKSYYDKWFKNYYSEYEQKCNFRSYLDSVYLNAPCRYFPLFFSRESVEGIDIDSTVKTEYVSDYILEHNLSISDSDGHLSPNGHRILADHLYNLFDQNHRH